ncbi:MAG: hypothetical protein OEY97_05145 [Nitrospirota bacterium]|nr:hypothetical protein [Nitrospirota bacterium]
MTRNATFTIGLFFMLFLTGGCASLGGGRALAPDEGVVFGSVRMHFVDESGQPVVPDNTHGVFEIFVGRPGKGLLARYLSAPPVLSMFPSQKRIVGGLGGATGFSRHLASGEYAIYKVRIHLDGRYLEAYPEIRFPVVSGRANYLGALELDLVTRNTVSHGIVVDRITGWRVTDAYPQDVTAFRKHHPELPMPLTARLMESQP